MKTSNIIIISILLITLLFSTSTFAQPDYLQEVNSSDILKQIENGEDVYISDSFIKGKLDLSSANLSEDEESGLKIIRSQITILNSHFEEAADFSNTQFENKINFSKSHFKQDVDFRQSKFEVCDFSEVVFYKKADFRKTYSSKSNFENSIFNGRTFFDDSTLESTKFYHVTFTNESIFDFTTFKKFVDFRKSTFDNRAYFQDVTFDSVHFTDSTFNGSTEFISANFDGLDTDFTNTTFNGSTKFSYANFGSYTEFTNTTFNGSTEFISANFGGLDADFTHATFLDEVDFSNAVFTGDARFNNAIFKKNADFKRVEFNNVNFIDAIFEEVSFANADFSKINVEWDNIKDSLIFDRHFFIRLRENFIKIGEYGISDDVYYTYRKNMGKDKDYHEWFLDRAVLFICGYGVRPLYTLGTGVIVVLGFAGYYYCREHWTLSLTLNLFKKNDNSVKKGFCKDCCDACRFSIGIFIGTDYESSYSKNSYKLATMVEKILGSLIFTLFVVTLTNVLIRL